MIGRSQEFFVIKRDSSILCSIILFDKRFVDFDLDIIGGIHHYIAHDEFVPVYFSSDLPCNATRDLTLGCAYLVVPKSIDDIFANVYKVGEIYADLYRHESGWMYRFDIRKAQRIIEESKQ